jgi:hypothetical protein
MKIALVVMVALTLATVFGCASPKGGSVSSDEGFKIMGPTFATDVKQGDTQTVTVSLKRDKFFKQDVTLRATVTEGISVKPSKLIVKASDAPEAQFQIKAAKDAALGEYMVHVVATPATGNPTSQDFTVMVVVP